MAEEGKSAEEVAALRRKRAFRTYSFRGYDLDKLLDVEDTELLQLLHARARRRMKRGLSRKPISLMRKIRESKAACGPLDKPEPVKTHLRNMIIVPEMIGATIAVYNGKVFNIVEVKPDMVGHYLGEFSITYRPVAHGRPGIGSTNSSRFIPLK